MEVDIKDQSAKHIELEVDDDQTFFNPLREKLLLDDKVELVTYSTKHPLVDRPTFYVRVKDGKPMTAINRAIKALKKDFNEITKTFESSTKSFKG